jgi:cytidine deaminase
MRLTKEIKERLVQAAVRASKNAYHPVTRSGTGSAVLTKEGRIYVGCNVQSVISGLGCCSERCAIYSAAAHGAYNFEAIAIFFPSKKRIGPCGACLQLIHEFSEISGSDIKIIMVNIDGKIDGESSIRKLLPNGYGPRTADKDVSPYEKNRD